MKIDQMFPRKYATGRDLAGKAVTLTIATVQREQVQLGRKPEPKFVLRFENAEKGIILNRTMAEQIATITDSRETDKWKGHRVTLYPQPMRVAGKDRVAIRFRAPPAQPNGQSPPATLQEPDETAADPNATTAQPAA